MLDIRLIREKPDLVLSRLAIRGENDYGIERLLRLDTEKRDLLAKAEGLKKQRNETSKKVGQLKKAGENADSIQAEMRKIGESIKGYDARIKEIESAVNEMLLNIPNLPDETVPKGADEADNIEIRVAGEKPVFDFEPKPHNELGEALGIFDFKRAAKLAGARFAIYKGAGAMLERALTNFMLDIHVGEHGYTEFATPYMVNSAAMTGTGQLPKFSDDLFKLETADLWLIPTAEVPLTNIHSQEIVDGSSLPLKMVAHTPCFRSEAGSYGKDTAGLIRQHQFNKVELVKITKPEESVAEHQSLLENAEEILKRLDLPYRVVNLCGGDLGFSAARTYDIEVWVPSQNKYREISSCSTFTDYQARRMNLRFRREPKSRPEFPHTINGSGLAVGRTVVAIMENNQREDGSIAIPQQLRSYMGGLEAITVG